MKELSQLTEGYISDTPLEYRKKHGQYFTPGTIKDKAISPLPNIPNADILELSCGTGEFIHSILKTFTSSKIDAIELDEKLCKQCQNSFKNNKNVVITNSDSLEHDFNNKKYDLIIGNPPYFEFTPTRKIKNQYKDVISGRCNVYSLFIKLAIDLLKDNGYLSFVVPTSMLNGRYFSKLRKYIIKYCSIIDIMIIDDKSFKNALQNVMILILQKKKNNNKFIFKHNKITIFSPQYKKLQTLYKNSKCLSDLNFEVKTGTLVWNQHKDKLSDNEQDTTIIWSHNITNKGFILSDKKPQYVKNFPVEKNKPILAINRITGCGKKAYLKVCEINIKDFVCENHVNVISGFTKNTLSTKQLIQHIQNPKAIEALQQITGNTQISKTELEKLLPIWI